MKKNFFYLVLYIYKEHIKADDDLKKRQLDINNYEFSKIPFEENGERYIGLRYHIKNKDVYFKENWKQAYKLLCDLDILQEDANWGGHYKLLMFDFSKYWYFDFEGGNNEQEKNKKMTKPPKKGKKIK